MGQKRIRLSTVADSNNKPFRTRCAGAVEGFNLEQQARKQIEVRINFVDISGGNVNFDAVVSDVNKLARWVDFTVLLINKTTINVANYSHYINWFQIDSVPGSLYSYQLIDTPTNNDIPAIYGLSNTFQPKCVVGYSYLLTGGWIQNY